MPKKLLPSRVSALRPQPDSRMACAIVTAAGTWYERMVERAGPAAQEMNAAPAAGDGPVPSTHHGTLGRCPPGQAMYASETKCPFDSRSQIGVRPTRPETISPASWQR